MRSTLTAILAIAFAFSVYSQDQPKPKPKPEKKPVETFVDAAKAGVDFSLQGEYVGELDDIKLAVQVYANGDGQFTIKMLRGGLPGAGAEMDRVRELKGKLEEGKVKFGDDKGQGVLEEGKITATSGGREMTLKKVSRTSPTVGAKPPEGATVLFDGKNLDGWTKPDGKTAASWQLLDDGVMQVKGGDILSKAKFGACTIHVEFRLPFMPRATGQGRSNSGVYVQNRYEVQVLDSFGLKGLNNECGGIYTLAAPKVNMCLPPLAWQTYDIDFTPAVFAEGKKTKNAVITVKHNGVVIHENFELKGNCPGGMAEGADAGGIRLQDHGNPVQYRNIWVASK
jgi:hypothetical protein